MKGNKKSSVNSSMCRKAKQILSGYRYNQLTIKRCKNASVDQPINTLAKNLTEQNAKVLRTIESLKSPYSDVLYLYYIKDSSWQTISEKTNYSFEYVRGKLLKKAIILFIKTYSDENFK